MTYIANIAWQRNDTPFTVKDYDRTHTIQFGSGSNLKASSAPEYTGNAQLVNPEELFTAAVSSCMMLTFLHIAAMKGFTVDDYQATAASTLAKNAEGKMAITELTITPKVRFAEGKQPEPKVLEDMFDKAHANCFISNSVKTTVKVS